jgi:hypothetical protein
MHVRAVPRDIPSSRNHLILLFPRSTRRRVGAALDPILKPGCSASDPAGADGIPNAEGAETPKAGGSVGWPNCSAGVDWGNDPKGVDGIPKLPPGVVPNGAGEGKVGGEPKIEGLGTADADPKADGAGSVCDAAPNAPNDGSTTLADVPKSPEVDDA